MPRRVEEFVLRRSRWGGPVVSGALLTALAMGAVMGMAGCSGDDDPEGDGSKSPSPSASSSDTGIISPKLPKIPKFEGKPKGIISDVTVESCDTENGPVEASGTATNSAKEPADLVVVVSWAVTTTSDVVARGVATLEDVAPGDTVDWSVQATLDSPEKVACVPTALRGTLR